MARQPALTAKERKVISDLVEHYVDSQHTIKAFAESVMAYITNSRELKHLVHSTKWRLKDPAHFREKLRRKKHDAKQKGHGFGITKANLFTKINDLGGIRIIHLHTDEFPKIHKALMAIFTEQNLQLVEPPKANCWDLEFRAFYEKHGVDVIQRESLYTTVHYVIRANTTSPTIEIQVRTIVDELWGEVSHRVNYPTPTKSKSCERQLRILARLTTGCSRLVDSIFEDSNSHKGNSQKKRKPPANTH